MKKIWGALFWGLMFLVLLAVLDQALVRVELDVPGYRETRQFYVGFRERLTALPDARRPLSIEEVIERAPTAAPAPNTSASGYVYVDEQGVLHMVDSLEEVPPHLRREAKRLSR